MTWTTVALPGAPRDWQAVLGAPAGTTLPALLAFAIGGYIAQSADGISWADIPNSATGVIQSTPFTHVATVASTPPLYEIITSSNQVFYSSDGLTWFLGTYVPIGPVPTGVAWSDQVCPRVLPRTC